MIKYSLIVPIYNSEATVRRCLDSLAVQLRPDVEVILIDDGSTDATGAICRKYTQKYPVIRYYYKENGGVASARNFGLDQAKGEYILFVDSDDWVSEDLFAVADRYVQGDADFVLLSYTAVAAEKEYPRRWKNKQFYGQDAVLQEVAEAVRLRSINSPWAKIFKREIIECNGLRFPEELKIGEDKVFNLSYGLRTKSVVTTPDVVYYTRMDNPHSLTRRVRRDLPEQLLMLRRALKRTLDQANIPEKHYRKMVKVLSCAFFRNIYIVDRELHKYMPLGKERRETLKQVCEEYNREGVKPYGLRCSVMALPQKWKLVRLIDGAVGLTVKNLK